MTHLSRLHLVIVHYHFRPGGVRRVIELATPHLLRKLGGDDTVSLVGGEAADEKWNVEFRSRLGPASVAFIVEPAFNYLSEQKLSPKLMAGRIRETLRRILDARASGDCLVWAHNLSLARNVPLSRELARACAGRDVPLVLHHHDWWFENRWARWPEMRRSGVRTLRDAARVMFPNRHRVRHATINRADASILRRHFAGETGWLPNPAERSILPGNGRVRHARAWMERQIHDDAPVWLLPCRLLRRKNIAEALLLVRWLRPEAWLVTTGGVSSDDERAYGRRLADAALHHGWPLRLGVMSGDETTKPSVPELLAASEAVVLTSIVEGFGLPYVEAAAARRPLIARTLPNVAPDLHRLGFRFPQSYADVLVHPGLFDWPREVARQTLLFGRWKACLPGPCRKYVGEPPVLAARALSRPVAFSRLTLSAQLEVLAQPADRSWEFCAPLNPFLAGWRRRAGAGDLKVSRWPPAATRQLDGAAYARRFAQLLHRKGPDAAIGRFEGGCATQDEFLRERLAATHLFPLLWAEVT